MKNISKWLCFLVILSGEALFARQPAVPLLPPQGPMFPLASLPVTVRQRTNVTQETRTSFGFEFGALGRRQATESELMGMQLFVGGRIALRIMLGSRISLRPSLGYFRKSQNIGSINVAQNDFEGGLGMHYEVLSGSKARWIVGLSQRLDAASSSVSVYDSSQSSGADIHYRLGPATGIVMKIASQVNFTCDLEYTFTISKSARSFSSFTGGFQFNL